MQSSSRPASGRPSARWPGARLPVRVQLRTDRRLPGSSGVTAYYVAEAFTNAAKHANVSAADILIKEADSMLRVRVRDDGVGGADVSRFHHWRAPSRSGGSWFMSSSAR